MGIPCFKEKAQAFNLILLNLTPSYLNNHISVQFLHNINLRNTSNRPPRCRTSRFANSFFPFWENEWISIDESFKASESSIEFKKKLNNLIRPKGNSFYGICDNIGIKLLKQIRVYFSDLREHRFNHNFKCNTPYCACDLDEETSSHFFLYCTRYTNLRITYLSNVSDVIGSDISVLPSEHSLFILMYGSNVYNDITNKLIISETIRYIKLSGRFKKIEAFEWNFYFLPFNA